MNTISAKIKSVAVLTAVLATFSGAFAAGDESKGPDWSKYKWAVIGDSLSDPKLVPVGAKYYDLIAAETGIKLYVNAVGGTGYWREHEKGKAFYQRLKDLPSDVDVVTVLGSVNDWKYYQNRKLNLQIGTPSDKLLETNTVSAYMNEALDVIAARAPKAKVVLITGLYYYGVGSKYHSNVNKALIAVAKARGIVCHDWLNGQNDPKYDFHQINRDTGSVEFAKKYTRDYNEKRGYGHPSAAYNAEWMAPKVKQILSETLPDKEKCWIR